MDARATRMGSETLGYTAPRTVTPVTSEAQLLWGQVPPNIKTIIKVVVVAAVAYAALTLIAPGIAYTIGSVVAGIGSTVVSGIQATLAFFGVSTAAAGLGTAAAAETVTLGAGTAAAAAGIGTAAMMPAAKTAAVSSTVIAAPTHLPDISGGSVASIDPSTVLAKKSALASNAAMALDMPDVPVDHLADHHSHAHTDTGKLASKLGHEAVEINDHTKRHAASTRDHISQIEHKVSQWSERVGGSKQPVASHAEAHHKRDAAFASELHDERTQPDQGLGYSV